EDGLAFSSGMAAVFASLAGFLKSGDHVIACRSIFGSTIQILSQLLPCWGITTTYVSILKTEEWERAIRSETKMIFLETPSNPALELVDLKWLGNLKKKYPNILLNVDNCFATPYLQKPITYGIDLVCHSATKCMDS
ncbi:MAG: aminotransferase class I/II-fold pyridoxal phosphate-dependent enzyme, partial [Ginsengibacter sp.]